MVTYILPIGALMSWLGNLLHASREKLRRDSRDPFLKDLEVFGFGDLSNLPLPENDAFALAELKTREKDYEAAKHLLINAWLMTAPGMASEPAFLRLKEAFVKLYIAKGDQSRAERISLMPTFLLDREVQWIVTHPDQQLASTSLESPSTETEQQHET